MFLRVITQLPTDHRDARLIFQIQGETSEQEAEGPLCYPPYIPTGRPFLPDL